MSDYRKISEAIVAQPEDLKNEDFVPFLDISATSGSQSGPGGTLKLIPSSVFRTMGNVPVKFKYVSIDFEDDAETTLEKIAGAVNDLPNFVLEDGAVYYFFTRRSVLTNGEGFSTDIDGNMYAVVREHYAFTKKIAPDNNGEVSVGDGGTTVEASDFYLALVIDSRSFAPIEFDLGDIGTTEINDAVDTSGPYSTPNVTSVIFKATQDGTDKGWIYIGSAEEVGTGFPTTDLTDYREFVPGDVDPPPIQDYITKYSKTYKEIKLNDTPPKILLLSPESTSFNIENTAGS